MKKLSKRFISMLLIVVMAVGVVPMVAMATYEDYNVWEVSKIDGLEYVAGGNPKYVGEPGANHTYGDKSIVTMGDLILIEDPTFIYSDGTSVSFHKFRTSNGTAYVFRPQSSSTDYEVAMKYRIVQGNSGGVFGFGGSVPGFGAELVHIDYYYSNITATANLQRPVVATDSRLADVKLSDIAGHWAEKSIRYSVVKGMMQGVGGGKFNPSGNFSNAQTAQVLYNIFGKGAKAKAANYKDVDQKAWYATAVNWAVSLDLIPVTGNSFRPSSPITREDMVTAIYRVTQKVKLDLPCVAETFNFADAASISRYAVEPVKALGSAGVIRGKMVEGNKKLNWVESMMGDFEDGHYFNFDPKGKLTRAEAATILDLVDEIYQALKDAPINQQKVT
jgi:hypothetical protein